MYCVLGDENSKKSWSGVVAVAVAVVIVVVLVYILDLLDTGYSLKLP